MSATPDTAQDQPSPERFQISIIPAITTMRGAAPRQQAGDTVTLNRKSGGGCKQELELELAPPTTRSKICNFIQSSDI